MERMHIMATLAMCLKYSIILAHLCRWGCNWKKAQPCKLSPWLITRQKLLRLNLSLIIFTFINQGVLWSDGVWAENGGQRSRYLFGGTNDFRLSANSIIALNDGGSNAINGTIQNVGATGFEIKWEKLAGSLTGEARMIISASTHGGVV